MCLNLTEFLHLLVLISFLKEPNTVFLKSRKLIFFFICWKYWILFFVLNGQVRLQILLPLGVEGIESSYDQPMIHPIKLSMILMTDLFIYFAVVFFPLFNA